MINVIIMAGGQGTRFWPASTADNPKQFLKLFGTKSLIRLAYERAKKITKNENIYIVTGQRYAQKTLKEIPGFSKKNIIVEPIPKNTAPALVLSAFHIMKKNPKSVMVVLAADHLIQKENDFVKLVKIAAQIVLDNNYLITMGIKPNKPETGYGYIKIKKKYSKNVYFVDSFKEKPDLKTAKKYIKSGRYFWNSGMFIFRADYFLKNIKKYIPKLYKSFMKAQKSKNALAIEFKKMKKESIDYALMEKAENILVITADIGWNDVGSWSALEEVIGTDKSKSIVLGNKNISFDSYGNIIFSKKLIGTIGVKNMIIIESDNGILICPKDKAQDVKRIAGAIK